MSIDRHRQPRITLRAAPERVATWQAAADAAGVTLTDLAGTALDSLCASLRTAALRRNKEARHEARAAYKGEEQ